MNLIPALEYLMKLRSRSGGLLCREEVEAVAAFHGLSPDKGREILAAMEKNGIPLCPLAQKQALRPEDVFNPDRPFHFPTIWEELGIE